MTPEETSALLTYLTGVDSRFTTRDTDEAATRIQVWADLLADVDPQFALDVARRFYRGEAKWSMQPGTIRTAWSNQQRAEEAKARHRALVGRPVDAEDDVTRDARLGAREALRVALEEHGPPVPRRTPAKLPRYVSDEVFAGGSGE